MNARESQRIEYEAPPLHEARLSFYFLAPRQHFLPGLLYGAFHERLPEYELIQKHAELDRDSGELRWGSDHQFSNAERNLALLLGADYLAMKALKPYVGFADFLEFTQSSWNKFCELCPGLEVNKVCLNYDNVIPLKDLDAPLSTYVRGGVYVAPNLFPSDWELQHMKAELAFQATAQTDVRLISQSIGGQQPYITLNLEANSTAPGSIKDLKSWCSEAHEILAGLFEGFLTDTLKATFRPKSEDCAE